MVSVHELGLLTSVVEKIAEVCPGRTVTKVSMRVGDRSGVVYDSLIAAWPVASAATQCEGAEFDAALIVSTVYCPACAAEHEIDEFYALTCPVCGTPTADLRHGREFEISSIEVEAGDAEAGS
ncbi:hydrogenase maturation nickel metallochaperone HypA [uncultured Corynebacterium sp.]|uniref:hydrogenase maturation nickel metallochaperone HypA/HybF n=1 Tax=uncultured Corynebacterium sp. TaxID=159447 RepID=UPI0026283A27|nr:hydrogenase maturation nickel metallochaperone HypA [uncultured Corynebacterium sp.]